MKLLRLSKTFWFRFACGLALSALLVLSSRPVAFATGCDCVAGDLHFTVGACNGGQRCKSNGGGDHCWWEDDRGCPCSPDPCLD